MSEFSFIDNVGWLKPFIVALHKYYKCSTVSIDKISQLFEESEEGEEGGEGGEEESSVVPQPLSDIADNTIFTNTSLSFQDANEFATHNLNSIFRDDCVTVFNEKHSWVNCLDHKNYDTRTMCRVSRGFGNRNVPIGKKFNPKFYNAEYRDTITLAKYSYNYLLHRSEIETILKTPSSDYTRFSVDTNENIFNRFFMLNLRHIQKTTKKNGPFDHILATYNSKIQVM